MVAINRGDNTRAFGGDFLRIYLNNPNNVYISKAVFHVNGDLEKVYENPVFPLRVNFTGEETMLLQQDNTCQLALWDDSGRRRTANGKFTFFVRENQIQEPDNPDYYGDEYYDEDENSVTFDLVDPEFAAEFVINTTPTKMSELQQDIPIMLQDNIIGGRNVQVFQQDDNVIIEATLDTVQSYNSLIDKPSVNGIELVGNVEIACEQIQADYTENNPQSKAYIKNKPNFASVAFSGSYNHLSNTPTIPTKLSQLTNDTKYIDKNVENLENYYTKAQTEQLVQGSIDLDPVYNAINEVQDNLDEFSTQATEDIAVLRSDVIIADNQLKDQINSAKDNLNNKINTTDHRVDILTDAINDKVNIDDYVIDMSLKADTTYVDEQMGSKVDVDTYSTDMNKKADKSYVGKGTLVIKANSVNQGAFNANSSNDTIIDLNIPTKTSDLDNDLEFITKSELETDGFATKSYVDTKTNNLVSVDELGHGILDIRLNGDSKGSFNANAKQNKTIDLNVPTKLSELEKDIDILTEEDLDVINNRITVLDGKVSHNGENISDLYNEIGTKVDKVNGKSLIDNTEIARLANVDNYDDTELRNQINTHTTQIGELNTVLGNKVDKEAGKGLSTNDFTNEYKNTLNAVSEDVTELNTNVANLLDTSVAQSNAISGLQETTTELTSGLNNEILVRSNAINAIQEQIDGMTAKSSVADIVATFHDLGDYPTSKLLVDDVICVIKDETKNDTTTYYRWNGTTFIYIGSEGEYYTKGESNAKFVEKAITINGHTLDANVELLPSDVNALPADTIIGNGILTLQVEPTNVSNITEVTQKGTFAANQTTNNAIRIPIPTKTSHIENDSEFVNQNLLDAAVENVEDDISLVAGNLSTLSDQVQQIQGVISGDLSGLAPVAFSNSYNDLYNLPTIPTAFSLLENDMGILTSNFDPEEVTLEDVLADYQLRSEAKTKLSEFENDRGYVTNSAIGRGTLTVKINGQDFVDNTWMANEKDPRTIDIPVDSTLSDTSVLPVQNNTVTTRINSLDDSAVHKAGSETITGAKTFTNNVTITGITNLSTANGITCATSDNSTKLATTAFVKNQDYCTNTNAVHKTGSETISGNKEFTGDVTLNNAVGLTRLTADNSTNLATTAFVKNQDYATNPTVVHKTGNETIQGDKTFNDTTTFNGMVELGDDAHTDTPDPTSTHYNVRQVTNVQYVQAQDAIINTRINNEVNTLNGNITDAENRVEGHLSSAVSTLRGEIGAVEQALEDYEINLKTFEEITEASTVLELDKLYYMTVTEDISIVPPTVSDNYYHEIKIQMYVPTLYNISLGTTVTIDETGLYDITYIWFKPVNRWIVNIVKY